MYGLALIQAVYAVRPPHGSNAATSKLIFSGVAIMFSGFFMTTYSVYLQTYPCYCKVRL